MHGRIAACSLFPGVTNAGMIDLLPPSDPADGKAFRVICMHDVRDNLMATFNSGTAMVDAFAVDTGTLTAIFSWLQTSNYHTITVKQIEESRHGGEAAAAALGAAHIRRRLSRHYTKVLPLLGASVSGGDGPRHRVDRHPPDTPIRIATGSGAARLFPVVGRGGSSAMSPFVETPVATQPPSRGRESAGQRNCRRPRHLYHRPERYETDAEFHTRRPADLRAADPQRTGIVARSMVGHTARKTSRCARSRRRSGWTSSSVSMPARIRRTCRWTGCGGSDDTTSTSAGSSARCAPASSNRRRRASASCTGRSRPDHDPDPRGRKRISAS